MSRWEDLSETAFQIFDGDTQTCHWPPLLSALYTRARPWAAPLSPVRPPIPDLLARIGEDRRARLVVGAAPERTQPSTPDYDGLAAEMIREGLLTRGGGFDRVCNGAPEPVLTPIDRDLVVVGGPGSQPLSEAINQAVYRRDWGVRGFYFAPAGEAPSRAGNLVRCWRLQAHDLPEEAGIPDPDDPYARLPDGCKEDFGVLYVGANPLARRHGLIWVAGLGSVGTVGAALALQDPRVMEALAPKVPGEQAYGCALVRYRFADEQYPLDGALACMALTRGMLQPC
jgi:hypothetical protein